MNCRHLIAAALLLLPAPALACRCRVANTEEERAAYADSIAARSHVVAIGRFQSKARKGRRLFLVRERLAGALEKRLWVLDFGSGPSAGGLVYSGSCVTVTPWVDRDRVLVLRRRPEDVDYAPAYEADTCASSFLAGNPRVLARIARRSRPVEPSH